MVEAIVRVDSVDVVYNPIAGGKFLRMAAAAAKAAGQQKEANMFKKLLAALKGQRPDLKDQIEALEAKGDAATEEEVLTLLASAVVKSGGDGNNAKKDEFEEHLTKLTASITDITTKQAKETIDKAMKLFDDTVKMNACSTLLVGTLNDSLLPDILKSRVRKQFEGKIFEEAALTASIKEEKEVADKLSGSGSPQGVGGLRMEVGAGEPEKLLAAFD